MNKSNISKMVQNPSTRCSNGSYPTCDTGAVLYQLSYEAIIVGSRSIFSGSIMPLRVIRHYSDWVCTAVISNDVMKDLRG